MKRFGILIVFICLMAFGGNVLISCEGPEIDTETGGGHGDGSGEDGGNGGEEQLPDREPEGPDAPRKKEFVILFTNDFHSQIEPLGKEETYNADRGGIKNDE